MIAAISRILKVFNARKPRQKYWCSECHLPLAADEVHVVRGRSVCFICGNEMAHSCPRCGTSAEELGFSRTSGLGHIHCTCGAELVSEWDRHFAWKAVVQA